MHLLSEQAGYTCVLQRTEKPVFFVERSCRFFLFSEKGSDGDLLVLVSFCTYSRETCLFLCFLVKAWKHGPAEQKNDNHSLEQWFPPITCSSKLGFIPSIPSNTSIHFSSELFVHSTTNSLMFFWRMVVTLYFPALHFCGEKTPGTCGQGSPAAPDRCW